MEKNRAAEIEQKRQYWEETLLKWKKSGLSQNEFCRRNGLIPHRLQYWKKRIWKKQNAVSLVELGVSNLFSAQVSSSTPLKLIVNDCFRIEIADGFNPATLQQVICTLCRL